MAKIVYEGRIPECAVYSEDGGCALIWDGPEQVSPPDENEENGMFVRLHSWDERKDHSTFRRLVGQRVRITVERLLSPIELLAELD